MLANKEGIKETPFTSPLVEGNENGDGVPNGGENQKPPPTFEEMWFDDPIEGQEAQRLALELRKNVVLRAEPMRIYLERTGIVAILLQGLQHAAKARPSDPIEWLAAFLLKNNPRRDMVITPPKPADPKAKPNAEPEAKPKAEPEAVPIAEPVVKPKADSKKKK